MAEKLGNIVGSEAGMKVLMINGSSHKEGNVYLALHEMDKLFLQRERKMRFL